MILFDNILAFQIAYLLYNIFSRLYGSKTYILINQKYYMEHYYIWPKRRQIQFLCELEVTGQPQNAIKERDYDGRNWENLVPGSVEDNIYTGVAKYMEGKNQKEFFKHLPSFSDVMDSWFNIGI